MLRRYRGYLAGIDEKLGVSRKHCRPKLCDMFVGENLLRSGGGEGPGLVVKELKSANRSSGVGNRLLPSYATSNVDRCVARNIRLVLNP